MRLFASKSGGAPSVRITVEEEVYFVNPLEADFPTEDPILRGTVIVSLPAPRPVKEVRVMFQGLGNIVGYRSEHHESVTTLDKTLNIDLGGQVLEAGEHAFNFSFFIPSRTAVFQRCRYGRIRHYLKAAVEFAGPSSFLASNTIKSPSVVVFINASTSNVDGPPLPFTDEIQHVSDVLGPVGVLIMAPILSMACFVQLRVVLPSVSDAISIDSIDMYVDQQFSISFKDGKCSTPPLERHKLRKINGRALHESKDMKMSLYDATAHDPTPLVALSPEVTDEFVYERLFQMPVDQIVRPTTLDDTNTPVRVKHHLTVEISYSLLSDPSVKKVLSLSQKVHIASCCGAMNNMYLPAYSKDPPKTIHKPVEFSCMCHMGIKELYDRDGSVLLRASSIGGEGEDLQNRFDFPEGPSLQRSTQGSSSSLDDSSFTNPVVLSRAPPCEFADKTPAYTFTSHRFPASDDLSILESRT